MDALTALLLGWLAGPAIALGAATAIYPRYMRWRLRRRLRMQPAPPTAAQRYEGRRPEACQVRRHTPLARVWAPRDRHRQF